MTANRESTVAVQDAEFLADPGIVTIADLDDQRVKADDVAHISGARVVWADWTALRRDFFTVTALREDIESWLLASAAVMSLAQWASADLAPNGPPGYLLRAWRPPRYGRSAVVPVQLHRNLRAGSAQFLDVKGIGVPRGDTPRNRRGANGLLLLPDALRELFTQHAIDHLCRACVKEDLRGVSTYAILDLGFDARISGRGRSPAACLVRAAHRRSQGNVELPPRGSARQHAMLHTELLIRQFGFTSASDDLAYRLVFEKAQERAFLGSTSLDKWLGEALHQALKEKGVHGHCIVDRVNVQMTREFCLDPFRVRLVDFGQYQFRERFDRPLLSLVSDRLLNWGGLLLPEAPLPVEATRRERLAKRLGQTAVPTECRQFCWDTETDTSDSIDVECLAIAHDWCKGTGTVDTQKRLMRFTQELTTCLDGWSGKKKRTS